MLLRRQERTGSADAAGVYMEYMPALDSLRDLATRESEAYWLERAEGGDGDDGMWGVALVCRAGCRASSLLIYE